MNRIACRVTAAACLFLAAAMQPALAAGDAATGPSTAKDLGTVITLLGLPCGEVTQVTARGPDDHVATCKDGNRYRVYVNADGRVVADKQ